MLKSGQKILLGFPELKCAGVSVPNICAKSIPAKGLFILDQTVNGSLKCPCPSCFSWWMQQGHRFWVLCGLETLLLVCASSTWAAKVFGEERRKGGTQVEGAQPLLGLLAHKSLTEGRIQPELEPPNLRYGETFLPRTQLQGQYSTPKPSGSNTAGSGAAFLLSPSPQVGAAEK